MRVRTSSSTTPTVPEGILDIYTGAAAAYSLRKLTKAYTNAAIRVRRSNDNAEQNIGFTIFGTLDESELSTFVGANSGFITTWYDQSGNARNAVQANAALQPRIVNSGIVEKINGIPSVRFNAQFLDTATNIPAPSGGLATIFSVLPSVTRSYVGISLFSTLPDNEYIRYFSDGLSYPLLGRTARTGQVSAGMPTSGGLVFSHINNGSNHLLYRNRVLGATAALGGSVNTALCKCRIGASFVSDGNYISENIIFPRVLPLQEKITIENNMMSFYGIT